MPKKSKPRSAAGATNAVPRTGASSKVGKGRASRSMNAKAGGGGHLRSAETIRRLKMYNAKTIRNKAGREIGGQFSMKDRAGDREITAATGRIAPDRRWFGNTRVVDPKQLDAFRDAMTAQQADPYSVVLKRKALPVGLLRDAAEMVKGGNAGVNNKALLEQEPFELAFGKHSRRKRVKVDQLLLARTGEAGKTGGDTGNGKAQATDPNVTLQAGGRAEVVAKKDEEGDNNAYAKLLSVAQTSHGTYDQRNSREGIVPWGRDSNIEHTEGENVDWRHQRKDDLFLKGQSKRIWAEFFKVVDCSDVVLHVIDARNVPGTRCTMVENHIRDNAKHKHLVFVLNKIDLVPNWVAKRWMGELAKHRPTIAFHASMTHAFGKGALISLLRQFGKLHEDKKQISVGVIGYPNVGKSSVINTLISKKSCNVAPVPGETKIWQYITLFKRIALIDCPGVVVDTAGDTETDSVLKGVVRAERLESPEDFVPAIMEKVQRQHINAQYKLTTPAHREWKTANELLETIAMKCGRLLKGGEPCRRTAAIMLINDYQRGRLPHYVAPPELKDGEDDRKEDTADIEGIKQKAQNLDRLDGEAVETSESQKPAADEDDEVDAEEDDDDDVPDSSALVVAAAGKDWDE